MADSFHVNGLEGLLQKFQDLDIKAAKKSLRKALKAGGDVFQQEIIARAPERTGQLRAEIASSTSVNPNEGTGTVSVGPLQHAFYGEFAEFGTRHQPAHPFMRPAIDSKAGEAIDAFANTLRDAIDEAAQ